MMFIHNKINILAQKICELQFFSNIQGWGVKYYSAIVEERE
jgi:hypothetical protein